MKLKIEFEEIDLDGEKIVIPVGASAEQHQCILRINESAKHLLDLLNSEITEEQLWTDMSQYFGISQEQAATDGAEMLEQLREEGLVTA